MKKQIFFLTAFLMNVGCKSVPEKCDYAVEKITSVVGFNGNRKSYFHSVLMDDLPRVCADSISLRKAYIKYISNLTADTPVTGIAIYNSTENFDLSEISQTQEINQDCLIKVTFKEGTFEVEYYMTYDKDGNVSGAPWSE